MSAKRVLERIVKQVVGDDGFEVILIKDDDGFEEFLVKLENYNNSDECDIVFEVEDTMALDDYPVFVESA